jgi:hypothetical protein
MMRTYGLPMALELLKVPMSSPDTEVASTLTRDAVLSALSYFSRRQDELVERHNGRPGKRSEEKLLLVPEDRRKMLLTVSS